VEPEPTYGALQGWSGDPFPERSNGADTAGSSRRRRRTMAVLAVLIGLVLLVAGAGAGVLVSQSSPSNSTSTANTVLDESVAAAKQADSFEYVAITQGGSSSQSTVGTAQRSSGLQDITVDNPAYGTEKFSLVLVDGVVYFRGNAAALEDQLGVPSTSNPQGYANQWIAIRSSDSPYAALEAGITTDSNLSQVLITPHSATQVTGANGNHIWRLTGALPSEGGGGSGGTAQLDVAGESKLPLSYSSTQNSGGEQLKSNFTFAHWGKKVTVSAPDGSIAFSSLGVPSGNGSPPSSETGPTPTFST